uniref:aspartate aminotransferase family protein n=1 Tax=Pararhizobium sp. IMCC3301 TaxID=3067904 RepID=UPI0027413370|nr:aspartate aminotransferase family protein [Pararhizobium sp. IMCC3301]
MASQAQNSALFSTYARSDLSFDRGEGARLYTSDNEEYLDFAGGIAVSSVGHGHPHVVSALKDQADKLWHLSNLYHIPGQERLAQRLAEVTFADKVFFGNSGAEALECAIKTARRYQFVNGAPQRYRILTFEGAFHGRTLATLAAGGQEKYLEGFGPKAAGFDQVAFADHEAMKAAVSDETAAILIEPIQGEGGLRPVPHQCLRGLRELCDEQGLMLIFDEVQTGVGRTGKLFAHEWAGIEPDIMAIAKGIGAGFPIGACLATASAAAGMTAGTHGSTFGGNPLGMAVGNAVLDIILAPSFLEEVQQKGLHMKQKLAELADTHADCIEGIRGVGLMLGIQLKKTAFPDGVAPFVEAARRHHLLTVGAGNNVVRLLPPLTVSREDTDLALQRMDAAFSELSTAP